MIRRPPRSTRPAHSFPTRRSSDLTKFSLERDKTKLIPYIKAALAVKENIRFWASPWTPPVWMKTGYKKNSGADSSATAKKPSYRSEEHTSELQSLMRISYAVFCLKKKKHNDTQ